MTLDVVNWMDDVSGDGWHWYIKYLSGNDTLLNESHQAGPYIGKQAAFKIFPTLNQPAERNPRVRFPARIDSDGATADVAIIWYNNRLHGNTSGSRNECRITGWGGKRSPILNPDATGTLCIFAFFQTPERDAECCRVWLCRSTEEEDVVQDHAGPIEPGAGKLFSPTLDARSISPSIPSGRPCQLRPEEIRDEWLIAFPDPETILNLAIARLPSATKSPPDKRLLDRRNCEYQVFRSIEQAVVLPRIREGFATVDLFVEFANSVTNRRKSRSGSSLERQARRIFDEEGLPYAYNEESEASKRPDFIFPSASAYRDPSYPEQRLQMLAVKTTCKDRWRQVIDEAERISPKYLLTLQEGVSLSQFGQMQAASVKLVVPKPLFDKYHKEIRPHLTSLAGFIELTKQRCR